MPDQEKEVYILYYDDTFDENIIIIGVYTNMTLAEKDLQMVRTNNPDKLSYRFDIETYPLDVPRGSFRLP